MRRLGRQESLLSRETHVTAKEKDAVTSGCELSGLQNVSAECKTNVDTRKAPLQAVAKSNDSINTAEMKSSTSSADIKTGAGIKHLNAKTLEATCFQIKASEKTPDTSKSPQQDTKKQIAQTDGGHGTTGHEKTQEKEKGTVEKKNLQKAPTAEQDKQHKGSETGGFSGSDGVSDATKTKVPAPSVPPAAKTHPAPRYRAEKPANSSWGTKEEKRQLEVLEENSASHSSNAASPGSNKSRAMSPGDKASFVNQLTSVAKTVLGPMKGGSQEGGKVKDTSKSSEEKKGSAAGKAEASSTGVRRGAQGFTTHHDKGNSRSSKHH